MVFGRVLRLAVGTMGNAAWLRMQQALVDRAELALDHSFGLGLERRRVMGMDDAEPVADRLHRMRMELAAIVADDDFRNARFNPVHRDAFVAASLRFILQRHGVTLGIMACLRAAAAAEYEAPSMPR